MPISGTLRGLPPGKSWRPQALGPTGIPVGGGLNHTDQYEGNFGRQAAPDFGVLARANWGSNSAAPARMSQSVGSSHLTPGGPNQSNTGSVPAFAQTLDGLHSVAVRFQRPSPSGGVAFISQRTVGLDGFNTMAGYLSCIDYLAQSAYWPVGPVNTAQNAPYTGIWASNQFWQKNGPGVDVGIAYLAGQFTFPATMGTYGGWAWIGLKMSDVAVSGGGTALAGASAAAIYAVPNVALSLANFFGLYLAPTTGIGGGTITNWYGIRLLAVGSSGSVGNSYGLYIQGLPAATGVSLNLVCAGASVMGSCAFGGSYNPPSAAPVYAVDIQGAGSHSALGLAGSGAAPASPAASNGTLSIYGGATNTYLLLTYNDAGTVRYRYMQLNGTAAAWAEGASLPT